jgi:hypothetical protein
MPYIDKPRRRALIIEREVPATTGELNFLLTREVIAYVVAHGLCYRSINDVLGALEGAKQEFYRRVAVPYEDVKRAENGDVYESCLRTSDGVLGEGGG